VRIDAKALVVVSSCDEELLEMRDAVQLAIVQGERVHPVETRKIVVIFITINSVFKTFSFLKKYILNFYES